VARDCGNGMEVLSDDKVHVILQINVDMQRKAREVSSCTDQPFLRVAIDLRIMRAPDSTHFKHFDLPYQSNGKSTRYEHV
jgi:hypothetical protein